jgi:hypothetical protein
VIEVTTSIQPLTKVEADAVMGTTTSSYFQETFKKTLAATNLTLADGSELTAKLAEPAKPYAWPKPKADGEGELARQGVCSQRCHALHVLPSSPRLTLAAAIAWCLSLSTGPDGLNPMGEALPATPEDMGLTMEPVPLADDSAANSTIVTTDKPPQKSSAGSASASLLLSVVAAVLGAALVL